MLIVYLLSVYMLCTFVTMVIVYHELMGEDPKSKQSNTVGAMLLGCLWPLALFYVTFKFLIHKTEKFIYSRRGSP